jgi:hypothetical protein
MKVIFVTADDQAHPKEVKIESLAQLFNLAKELDPTVYAYLQMEAEGQSISFTLDP